MTDLGGSSCFIIINTNVTAGALATGSDRILPANFCFSSPLADASRGASARSRSAPWAARGALLGAPGGQSGGPRGAERPIWLDFGCFFDVFSCFFGCPSNFFFHSISVAGVIDICTKRKKVQKNFRFFFRRLFFVIFW